MKTNPSLERFHNGAEKYAAYMKSVEGRLRLDLAFSNLQGLLPQSTQPLRVLDVGCGTGATGVRLARLGFHVTLLDPAPPMLDLSERAARDAGVIAKIALKHGDDAELDHLFVPQSFDVVLCHNVLEYVDDPVALVRVMKHLLRNSSSLLSLLVRNQAGEVIKTALQTGDLSAAEKTLTAEWGTESLYGGNVRLFTPQTVEEILTSASLTVVARRGVRVISDYLPPKVSRSDEYDRIISLESQLGKRPEFVGMARYLHYFANGAEPGSQEEK